MAETDTDPFVGITSTSTPGWESLTYSLDKEVIIYSSPCSIYPSGLCVCQQAFTAD